MRAALARVRHQPSLHFFFISKFVHFVLLRLPEGQTMPVMEAAAKKLARRSGSVEAEAASGPHRRPSLHNGAAAELEEAGADGDATVARAAAALVSVDIDEGAKPLDFSASENNSPGI